MSSLELRALPPVILTMADRSSPSPATSLSSARGPRPVRKGLLLALALSVLVHAVWTLWPVEFAPEPEGTVLTATLTEMPPPPVPRAEPAPARASAAQPIEAYVSTLALSLPAVFVGVRSDWVGLAG